MPRHNGPYQKAPDTWAPIHCPPDSRSPWSPFNSQRFNEKPTNELGPTNLTGGDQKADSFDNVVHCDGCQDHAHHPAYDRRPAFADDP